MTQAKMSPTELTSRIGEQFLHILRESKRAGRQMFNPVAIESVIDLLAGILGIDDTDTNPIIILLRRMASRMPAILETVENASSSGDSVMDLMTQETMSLCRELVSSGTLTQEQIESISDVSDGVGDKLTELCADPSNIMKHPAVLKYISQQTLGLKPSTLTVDQKREQRLERLRKKIKQKKSK